MRLAVIAVTAGVSCLAVAAIAARTSPLTTPAPASGTGVSGAQCFRPYEVRNRIIADDQTLLLNVDGRATYRLTMTGRCLAGSSSNSDPISTNALPGRSTICAPKDVRVTAARGKPCFVDSIAVMPAEEVAALPKKYQP